MTRSRQSAALHRRHAASVAASVAAVGATLLLACGTATAQPAKGTAEPANTASAGRSGAEVYAAVCSACHATGALNAPKFGDAKAWTPLIAEGQRALTRAAIRGIRGMPARGGDTSLGDREVERAVVHMANAAGGKFRDPK